VWLKLSFVALVGLAIFAFSWNWRFMAGLRELRQMKRAVTARDVEKAADCAERAAGYLPEISEVTGLAHMYRGIVFLSQEQSAKAVECLRKAKQAPGMREASSDLDRLILSAEEGVAFDNKNYDEFLAKAKIGATRWPDPSSIAGLASAYACKYATTGSAEYRKQAQESLKKAVLMAGPKDPDVKEYTGRIQLRLDTREIITRAEYMRRFPNGYQPKAKP
jgi:tetratricopeptide (TPR) repeat protein